MKKKTLLISLNIIFHFSLFSQNNQITLNAGYSNQSFYSFQNGEILNIENNNWDIAFSTDAFASTIRINDGKGVQLFTYHLGDTSAWSTINTNTPNTLINQMYNSDINWSLGAFDENQTAGFDYGWGVYNLQTHHIIGDSLFVIKTVAGNWKKLWIESKESGEYYFKYANLDGSNQISQSIAADNYSDKRFIYYSLESDLVLDREPIKSDWEITFTKYITPVQGMPYSVTGVLGNIDIEVAQADNIQNPLSYTDYSSHNFDNEINSIGYDWKSFQGSYVVDPNRCYFIKDYNQNIWRLAFTGFDGTSTGNIEFNTELISVTGINDLVTGGSLNIYPNPSIKQGNITFVYDIKSNNSMLNIFDLNGKKVYSTTLVSNGLKTHTVPANYLSTGSYVISLEYNGNTLTKRLVVN